MKRFFLLSILSVFALCVMAEKYTIVFNSSNSDSTNPTTELSSIVLSATNNCVDEILLANNVYRAKEGFGVKGGKSNGKGELTLGLDDLYHITTMTVYAATYPHAKDTAATRGFIVCGQERLWTAGHRTEIYPYEFTLDQDLDYISISGQIASYNRWYVQKIEFEAEDPHPTQAILEMPYPKMDFGGAKWESKDEPLEDVLNFEIIGKHIDGPINISLQTASTVFSLSENTLPSEGGEVDIFYSITLDTVTKAIPFENTIVARAIGLDGVERTRELPIVFTVVPPGSGGASTFDLDTTRMAVGPLPVHFYEYAYNTTDSTLKSRLGYIICCGKRYRYGSGSKKSWDAFFHTDRDTATNQVLDMYSKEVRYFDPEKPTASVAGFDIEHMLPKSWWGGDINPAYCDIFHLVPGDASANRSKSNHAPGVPADSSFYNGSFVTGRDTIHNLQRVFCPADEYKGDFARAYFYIATCYGDSLTWVEKGEPGAAMTNESWEEFRPWLRDLLLEWHRMDKVSEKEKARAIEVNKIQGNRNPFIDYPELAEYIWGEKQGEPADFSKMVCTFDSDLITGVSNPSEYAPARKEIRDGRLVIIRNASIFTTLGQKVQ